MSEWNKPEEEGVRGARGAIARSVERHAIKSARPSHVHFGMTRCRTGTAYPQQRQCGRSPAGLSAIRLLVLLPLVRPKGEGGEKGSLSPYRRGLYTKPQLASTCLPTELPTLRQVRGEELVSLGTHLVALSNSMSSVHWAIAGACITCK